MQLNSCPSQRTLRVGCFATTSQSFLPKVIQNSVSFAVLNTTSFWTPVSLKRRHRGLSTDSVLGQNGMPPCCPEQQAVTSLSTLRDVHTVAPIHRAHGLSAVAASFPSPACTQFRPSSQLCPPALLGRPLCGRRTRSGSGQNKSYWPQILWQLGAKERQSGEKIKKNQ